MARDAYEEIIDIYYRAENTENWDLLDQLEILFVDCEARETGRNDIRSTPEILDEYGSIEDFLYGFDIDTVEDLLKDVKRAEAKFPSRSVAMDPSMVATVREYMGTLLNILEDDSEISNRLSADDHKILQFAYDIVGEILKMAKSR